MTWKDRGDPTEIFSLRLISQDVRQPIPHMHTTLMENEAQPTLIQVYITGGRKSYITLSGVSTCKLFTDKSGHLLLVLDNNQVIISIQIS